MNTDQRLIVGNIDALLVRKDIKNLHLAVYPPDGRVRISAPSTMPAEAIRLAVIKRLPWVNRQRREILNTLRQSPREMVAGESHYLLGKRYRLKVSHVGHRSEVALNGNDTMVLRTHENASLNSQISALDRFYRSTLREVVEQLMPGWESRLGVNPAPYALKSMKTRWGTCSTTEGRITLNPQLVKQPRDCIEYVVVHELVHLIEPGHGELFITLINQYLPDWKARSARLNAGVVPTEGWSA